MSSPTWPPLRLTRYIHLIFDLNWFTLLWIELSWFESGHILCIFLTHDQKIQLFQMMLVYHMTPHDNIWSNFWAPFLCMTKILTRLLPLTPLLFAQYYGLSVSKFFASCKMILVIFDTFAKYQYCIIRDTSWPHLVTSCALFWRTTKILTQHPLLTPSLAAQYYGPFASNFSESCKNDSRQIHTIITFYP